jgi:hypothetical protein
MIESEAVEACRRLAVRRRGTLGPLHRATLLSEDLLPPECAELLRRRVGQWNVTFVRPSGFPTLDVFWVDDTTGRIDWINGLPPRWFQFLIAGLYYILAPLGILLPRVVEPVVKAWRVWRLPRCPVCRAKLRTKEAKQCFACGNAWHHGPPASVPSAVRE